MESGERREGGGDAKHVSLGPIQTVKAWVPCSKWLISLDVVRVAYR